MSQSIFVLETSFFENQHDLQEVAYELQQSVNTERAVLVYDPFCVDIFSGMIPDEKEKLSQLLNKYYSRLEDLSESPLAWHEVNETGTFYLETIGNLIFEMNWKVHHIIGTGILPVTYGRIKCYMYFSISPYINIPDKFYLLSHNQYKKILQEVSV